MYQYFTLLNLPTDATLEDLKKAYRKLALTHHPDVNGNSPEAVKKFQEINQAYEYLLDYLSRPPIPKGYYPPYPNYGTYPPYPPQGYPPYYNNYQNPYGYPPPPPDTPPQGQQTPPHYQAYSPPPSDDFQSYSWESVKEEKPQHKAYTPPKDEPPKEATPKKEERVSPLSQDILQASFEEALQESKRRILGDKLGSHQQLEGDINAFLRDDFSVTRHALTRRGGQMGFSVTSNKTGVKVTVTPKTRTTVTQTASFFGTTPPNTGRNPRRKI